MGHIDDQSKILLEDISPSGSLMAVVEDDGRTIYLHLVGSERSEFTTKSCWVRNLGPATMELDPNWQSAGRAPVLPFSACAYPAGMPSLDPETLSTIWFPEGDAVALLEEGVVIAVIPPWAGLQDCAGYAKVCLEKTPFAWPLGPDRPNNPTLGHVRAAEAFWTEWENDDAWTPLQRNLIAAIESGLSAKHTQYYSIDGNRWPPKFLVRVPSPGSVALMTGGVSIRPQPQVQRFYEDPGRVRRIEIGLALAPGFAGELDDLLTVLSRLSAFPWQHHVWLDRGHTVPILGIPVGESGTEFPAGLLVSEPPGAPEIPFEPYHGDPINQLWLIPITAAERKLAIDEGVNELIPKLWTGGVMWIHRDRESVV